MNHFNEDKAVGRLSELLALERGYSPEKAKQVRTAAALHDIGKIVIKDSILQKPGKLTAEEIAVMKTHTLRGAEIISSIQGSIGKKAELIARYHHEWNNPSLGGYWGIAMNTLPDYISFAAISDVYCALVSNSRPYKKAWSKEDALAYIKKQAGAQFCPELANDFISLVRNDSRVPAIFDDMPDI